MSHHQRRYQRSFVESKSQLFTNCMVAPACYQRSFVESKSQHHRRKGNGSFVIKDRLLKANHNIVGVDEELKIVIKDRLLKANHNCLVVDSTFVSVIKDRLLKANHN